MNTAFKALLGVIGVIAAATMVFVGVGTMDQGDDGIREIGQYDNNGDANIVVVEFPPNEQRETILRHAQALKHQTGKSTEAYYFYRGVKIPVNEVANAESKEKVKAALYEESGVDNWRFAYLRSADGSDRLVDCQKEQSNALCRQKQPDLPTGQDGLRN
jgi:hypothetical protein